MAIHHTRRKKALSLIGEETDQGKIVSLLKENEFTDDEIRELLAGAPALADATGTNEADSTPVNVTLAEPAALKDKKVTGYDSVSPPGQPTKPSKYADFDVFMGKAISKEYRHISGEMRNYISHFQLGEKVQTVRIEPALAKNFNAFAIGFIDNPGKMYFPAGEKQVGDIQKYNDPTYKPMNETTVTNEFMD